MSDLRAVLSDSRAVSTTLGYVLSLAIATLLITGLIIAGGGYVDAQREQVIRDELTVVGQQLAADVERADRLVRAGEAPLTVRVNKTFSDRVTGSNYRVSFDPAASAIVLETNRPFIAREFPADEVLGEEMVVVDGDFEPERRSEQGDCQLAGAVVIGIRPPVEPAR